MKSLFLKKSVAQTISEAGLEVLAEGHAQPGLKRSLGALNLTMLGIGVIIGAGIFSLTGAAAAYYAGPAIVYSFMLGGVLCALAGLCYAEMAAMVPVAGSAYAYTYATLGEFIAWIIGWDLILEYAFGAVTVSVAWSGYLVSLIQKTLGVGFGDIALRFTKGPWENVTLLDGSVVNGIWNLPASVIALVATLILYRGIRESSLVNDLLVVLKVTIILAFIFIGWSVIDTQNWIADPSFSGWRALIPAPAMISRHGTEMLSFGWPGVLTGAGVVFFAYIGFDAVSTTAQEAKDPQRTLPIGILASLVICTVIYILMSLTLTGVVSYTELAVPDPVAVGVDRISALHGWSVGAQRALGFAVKTGAILGLSSVILVLMLGQTRIFFAMSHDGLLPWFSKLHPKYASPHIATVVTGIFVALCGGVMPMSIVGELVSIGTLLAFVLVCVAIPILRITHPDVKRPFKVPAHWLISMAGAASCLWVMSGLPRDTWVRLLVWLAIGFVIYFAYGKRHSKLQQSTRP